MMLAVTCLSCKKDKNEIQPALAPVVLSSPIEGKWGMYDGNVQTRDTIYIYAGVDRFYMTCPDNNCSQAQDTIELNISGLNYTIPLQATYGTTNKVSGNGHMAGSNLYMDYTAATFVHNGLVFNRIN